MRERELIRYLLGELDEGRARAFEARLAADPRLRAELARLRRAWEGLTVPPPATVPAGFSAQVLTRARGSRTGSTVLPRWLPGAAAAAFLAGIALGAGLGGRAEPGPLEESAPFDETLAVAYGAALAEAEP